MLKSRIKSNTIKSSEYYGEWSRKLKMIHARLRHQCSSLNSDLFRIYITNDPKCHVNMVHLLKIQFII